MVKYEYDGDDADVGEPKNNETRHTVREPHVIVIILISPVSATAFRHLGLGEYGRTTTEAICDIFYFLLLSLAPPND